MSDKFFDLGLSEGLLKALTESGYDQPTPIQAKAIPSILMNRDVLGSAQTGTGKTASFTLPLLDILADGRSRARMPRSVILTPTRELAVQIEESFQRYGKYSTLQAALLIGGVAYGQQEQLLLKGVDVLIATPGRLMDHLERGALLLTDVKILVIDEADRMLDMGFIPDVERLVGMMPRSRQTLMFSATMPPEIRRLADKFLSNPKEISVAPPSSASATIDQSVKWLKSSHEKHACLLQLLADETINNGIIFCNRKRETAALTQLLQKNGLSAAPLHGDLDQYRRLEYLGKFRNGEVKFLVCSDVAARGLDIPAVSHVFNYDVPTHAEDYVHRIGRTGRAGRTGKAITLAVPSDTIYWQAIESLIGQNITSEEKAPLQNAKAREEPSPPTKGRRQNSRTANSLPPKAKPSSRAKQGRNPAPREEEVNDDHLPFGESSLVPAFLRR